MELTTDTFCITRNVQSLRDVPASHITPETRLALLQRAAAGEDVRAYGSLRSPTQIINLWDWDTRIPFFPLAQQRWTLEQAERLDEWHSWRLTLATVNGEMGRTVVDLFIERHPWENDPALYLERAARVATMVEHYINLYQDNPVKYNGCHF